MFNSWGRKLFLENIFFCLKADHVLTDQTECNRTTCLVLINFSDFTSYPNPWTGIPSAIWLYFPRREMQRTVKEVWREGCFDPACCASSLCGCLVPCSVSWSTSCLQTSQYCWILHRWLSISDRSQVLLLGVCAERMTVLLLRWE